MRGSNARELWDAIRSGRTSAQHLVSHRIRESLIIEYKEVPVDYKDGKFRVLVSRAVSGFANSAGGVVVWGIATGKGPDRDLPVAIPGVPDPTEFIAWLNDLIPNAIQPACITHTEIFPGSIPAVVATYIPESDLPPHQAVLETNKPYDTRFDGQFKVMEHHMLEDMFGRRRGPKLSLMVESKGTTQRSSPGPSGTVVTVSAFHFTLRNDGRGTGRYPTVMIAPIKGPNRVTWKNLRPYAQEHRDGSVEVSIGIERIIYPNSEVTIGDLEVTWYSLGETVGVTGTIQAEDMVPRKANLTLNVHGQIEGNTEDIRDSQ